MIDIDERLRRDAACLREETTPALDELLDRVMVPRRRHAAPWLAAAAAVAAAGLVAVVALRPWSVRPAPAAPPAHRVQPSLVRTFVADLTPDAAVGDPRSSTIDFQLPCPTLDAATQLRLTPGSVHVRISGFLLNAPGAPRGSYECGAGPTQVEAQLPVVLGSRAITCDCSANPIPLVTGNVPVPGHLPRGYVPDNGANGAGNLQYLDPAANRLTAERDFRNGTDRLIVVAGLGVQMPAATQHVVARATVRGHDAAITTGAGTCVTWQVGYGVQEAVCSIGHPASPLPTGAVLSVARSLH